MVGADRTVEFFFDFGSPASYLAYTQLPAIAQATGATIAWRPMLLGGVFKATGNASPAALPAKARWMAGDLRMWAKRYGVAFTMNPHFPINTLALMRGAVGLQLRRPEGFAHYVETIFDAMWARPRDLGDPTIIASTLAAAGIDAAAVAAMTAEPDVKAALAAVTEEAVARGVFGAPTMFVGERMFFGQDRLEFVREALAAGGSAG
ncbi:MAG TPA: 2-hydroxychromene-2-carboxylate isomerase [Burkholderiaceae bacterium]|nr:2-hydroxychromene-2-carboxylate isomerase [Burkholderiaceae bacterium]